MSSTARRCPTAHPARKQYTPSSTWRQRCQHCLAHVVMSMCMLTKAGEPRTVCTHKRRRCDLASPNVAMHCHGTAAAATCICNLLDASAS